MDLRKQGVIVRLHSSDLGQGLKRTLLGTDEPSGTIRGGEYIDYMRVC
jgi:hypothetical protein